tara:strand:- start:481 stop:1785 length:1305 start_codon:yes stop_codon:yes gene_type:complete
MFTTSVLSENLPPLAERVRPQIISDFIGQEKLLHPTSLLIKSIKKNNPFSIIFWGPPGTGKTTLSRILSYEFDTDFYEISAVSGSVKNVREVLEKAKKNFPIGKRSILFIDEIHRFSKAQQASLLHGVEDGSITLIGATTENPSFELIKPLLSRCQVLQMNYLNNKDLINVLKRALNKDIICSAKNINMSKEAISLIIKSCSGDARKMLNTLELSISMMDKNISKITLDNVKNALQKKHILYDKKGDFHYDVISAFIKSIRGSDPDAAIYWLAIMLEGGETPEFIARRLLILASEDVGNAEPYALQLATAAFDAVHKIGMPESRIILSQITIYLASVPKSNSAYLAIDSAIKFIKEKGTEPVPIHLRNAPTKLMQEMEFGKDYKYAHNYKNHFIKQNYFPENFKKEVVFYTPTNEGREKFLKERLEKKWKKRYK